MKQHSTFLKTGFNAILILAVLLFLCGIFGSHTQGEAYRGSFASFSLDDGWTVQAGALKEENVTLPTRIPAKRRELITVSNTLPEDIIKGMSLSFMSSAEDVKIYIDGKQRASYTLNDVDPVFGNLPSSHVFVDLTTADTAKEIEIHLWPYDSGKANISTVEYSYGNNIWFGHLKSSLAITFIAVALILIGIVAAVVFAFLHKKVKTGSSFLYLSQFIIVISLWLLSESKIRQLFFGAPYFTAIVAYLFVDLIAAYAITFVDELQGHYYQRIFNLLETVIILQIIVNTVLNFTGIAFYHNTLIFSHIWSAAAIITVVVTMMIDVRTGRIKKYLIAAYGIMGVAVFSVIEILLFYLTDKSLLGIPIGIGLLVLLGTTLAQTVNDIMMLKQQKDQNEMAAQIANEANLAKSKFLAQMSHEIRTPINAVLGMNEMILRESKEEDILEYAANAYNAGKALLSVINDILDISKIEAGKLEIMNSDYDIYSLVSDCYNMTFDRAEKKGLEFLYTVDENLPKMLHGDMFHIRQIVVNFLTNAIKYTDEGSVELIFGGKNTEAGFVLQISVKDTGIGLTQEAQEKLFENFQRFDLERNQSVEGTGLGLSICKQLAGLMDGDVSVQSEYGKGSVFSCMIPQTVVDDTPVGKMVIHHSSALMESNENRHFMAEKAHILVVDDVDMNVTVFKSLLKGHKMKIDTALSGRECLDKVQKEKYDIIFMDHMMPEMDGMETYAHMKEMQHLNQDVPVIMLTANAIMGEKEKYLEAGFVSYLTKPIVSEKLDEVILEYLPKEKIRWEAGDSDSENDTQAKNIDSYAGYDLNRRTGQNSGDFPGDNMPEKRDSGVEGVRVQVAERKHGAVIQGNTEDADSELINTALGLSYAGNDEETYYIILASYIKNGKDHLEKMESLFSEEAWKDYVILAHAVKSTSLTIGAEKLSKMAEKMEAAGKAGDYGYLKEQNGEFLELYRKVLARGEEQLKVHQEKLTGNNGKDGSSRMEISADTLLELQKRIRKATDAFDDEEMDAIFTELADYAYHGISLSEALAEVKELSDDFEYKQAGELSERIFEEL